MNILACFALGLGLLGHAHSATTDALQLAKDSGCLSCHHVEDKVIGPSFRTIANKYATESGAAATLAQSIRHGSRGKWGRIPMPGHGNLGPDELKRLSEWVLTFKN